MDSSNNPNETRNTACTFTESSNSGGNVVTAPPRSASLHSIPPPPPPFKLDTTRYKDLTKSNVRPEATAPFSLSSTLPTLAELPVPPPPLPPLKSSIEPMIPAASVSVSAAAIGTIETTRIMHIVQVPPMSSAPNSGDLHSSMSDDDIDHNQIQMTLQETNHRIPPPPPPPPLHNKPKRHMSFSSAPALKLLSSSQSHIPILVLATSTAQSLIKRKNQMTIGQLFTAMTNSCITHAPQLLGRLQPLKSIHRPMILQWQDLHFRFYDGTTSSKDEDITWKSWEDALSYACQTWEGDSMLDIYQESNIEKRLEVDSTNTFPQENGADKAFELTAPYHLPWLLRLRSIVDMSTIHAHPGLISCPPVCLLVATTTTSDAESLSIQGALESLTELANIHHWPSQFHNGLYDPKAVRKEYLLIHDEVDGPKDFVDAVALRDMQSRFGHGCCNIIRIHGSNTSKSIEDPLWDAYVPPVTYPQSKQEWKDEMTKLRGLHLDDKDMLTLRKYLIQMITTTVIPSMERRISHLNLAVANGKKGVKNALKSLWRKPKDSSTPSATSNVLVNSNHGANRGYPPLGESAHRSTNSTTPSSTVGDITTYRYDSIESQTKLLADSLFLLRDFEAALETYRLVKDDYKQDKSLMECATVYEMMALCLIFLDLGGNRNKREILQCVDSALFYYSSAAEEERPKTGTGNSRPTIATLATRFATRLCFVISSHRNICSNNDLEMADMLASSSSNETAVAAGTLLEQSACHYYRAGMQRKFGFHMLMAGHMFRSSSQDHHALRCFTSAMYVYSYGKARWDTLSHHVTSALASQLQNMDKTKLSVLLYAKLVSKGGKMSGYMKNLLKGIERLMSETSTRDKNLDNDFTTPFQALKRGNILEFQQLALPIIRNSSVKSLPLDLSHVSSTLERFGEQFKTNNDNGNNLMNDDLGSESIWQDLMSSIKAEFDITKVNAVLDSADTLSNIMAAICKHNNIASSANKTMRKPTPGISRRPCIRMEPILVSLEMTNPLSISLPISELQLIAQLRCQRSGKIYSNEKIMSISDTDINHSNNLWTFQTSREIFYIPEFYHNCKDIEEDSTYLSEENIGDGPCYVVSKLHAEVQPQATMNFSLEICPLLLGELDIIGVRWKAFDQFWVHHKFQFLRESSTLKFKIEEDLPNLIVDFVPIKRKHILLQGEVDDWVMKFSNIGTAPASDLFLKSNFPWIRGFPIYENHKSENSEVSSNFIGPTGTFMRIPLNELNIILPGQTVEVPIQVRPSGGGRQDCYLLFSYKLARKGDEEARVRWIRKILSFQVYPSITITASLMPFYRTKRDHILSLDITNYRSDTGDDQNIYLSGVYVASSRYEIKKLIDLVGTDPIKIDRGEQRTLHFLLCPTESTAEDKLLSQYLFVSSNVLDEQGVLPNSCTTDFVCIENAHEQFTAALDNYKTEIARLEVQKEKESKQPRHVAHIRRDKSSMSDVNLVISSTGDQSLVRQYDVSSLNNLCPPEDVLNVICCWTSLSQNGSFHRKGQHHLRGLVVRPQYKCTGCPLNIYAKYASTTSHDFVSHPLSYIDFIIVIRNRLVLKEVDFELTLLKQPNVEFMGCESFLWSLGGGEEIEINMKAAVFSSGVYNLQNVQVSVLQNDGITKIPYIFPIQWLTEVRDK